MDERSLKALEFDKVREAVAAYAFSSLGAARARAMVPDADQAPRLLAEAAEMMAYTADGSDFPLAGLSNVGVLLQRLALGGVLTGGELVALRDCLLAAARAQRAFRAAEKYPGLSGYAAALDPLRELTELITRQLDDDGGVRDDATPQLAQLRRKIIAHREEITTALERILNTPRFRRALREPIVTQRGGRYVLPVRTDAMGTVRGIVHGHSSSGVTAFVEPMALVDLNNRLEGSLAEEEAEVERILRALSHACAQEHEALVADLAVLEELDFIAARAGYGLAYRGVVPALRADAVLELHGARHPLLLATRSAVDVVPIDFALGADATGMVISGPNNGGKTVALKTAGLLAAMALAGVPLPAAEESAVGAFDAIYADIGDESSIEGNLSTFTAHMTNVGRFLTAAGPRTLVLLDELGVGTSPKYGVAIATAVLRRLRARGARVACTTHYDELKTFAFEEEGFLNAAVDLDAETLAPTYVLQMGRPGGSEAFAILERLNFPADGLAAARDALDADEASLAGLLTRLATREAEAVRKNDELDAAAADLAERRAAFDDEAERYRRNAARLKEEAYEEAGKVLREARRQAALIIRELRERADVAGAEELRRQLLAAERDAAAARELLAAEQPPAETAADLVPGQWALVRGTKTRGEVLEVTAASRRAKLRFGGVEVWVDYDDLTPAAPPGKRGTLKTPGDGDVSATLNLIGFRVEDALLELERYLDRAVLAHLPSVEIVHGFGTGRLRDGVRRYLRTHAAVASFGPGAAGNEGSTVAKLRT
jgi:DNA mismatch repair protein MutS2